MGLFKAMFDAAKARGGSSTELGTHVCAMHNAYVYIYSFQPFNMWLIFFVAAIIGMCLPKDSIQEQ